VNVSEFLKYRTQWKVTRYADQGAFERGEASPVIGGDGALLPAESVIEGNLLLDEGVGEVLDLLGGTGSPTAFNNANARIGVGDGAPTALTGTLGFTNGSTAVTGSGTAFTTELVVGDHLVGPDLQIYTVQSITSNTALVLTGNYAGTTASGQTVNKILRAIKTQTDLQASTNKVYKGMDAGFPQRSGQTQTWQAQFTGAEANFPWNEVTVANGASGAAKNLNRKVAYNGVKAPGQVWTMQVSLTLS
jgi:hypothetical protein